VSGFLHGAVLFCSLPLKLGVPFGGFTEVGGVVAVGLWLYLFHVIVLAGYAATREFSHWLRDRRTRLAGAGTGPAGPAGPATPGTATPGVARPDVGGADAAGAGLPTLPGVH
jgi:membrane protein